MKVDQFTQKGFFHNLHTEDALFYTSIKDPWFIAAVMDGCSSGKESYFMSTLYCKILEKTTASLTDEFLNDKATSPQILNEFILEDVFNTAKQTCELLELDTIEILSTLILMVYNKDSQEICINVSGDGCFSINNKIINIDQNNVPDFMGYHFNLPFQTWLKNHTKTYSESDVQSAFIATDGVTKTINEKRKPPEDFLLEYFLTNTHTKISLIDRYSKLMKSKRLIPADDIAIIGFK